MSKVKVTVGRERQMCAGLKGTELNMQPIFIKGIIHPKILILSFIYSVMLYQTCILVLNTKEDILKNVCNQTFAGPHGLW